MALFILCLWLYFVIAFILVRVFFPDVVAGRRSRKEIKGVREYDEFGYDRRGFTALGYHRNGTKYDDEGYDRDGYDKDGKPRPASEYGNGSAWQVQIPVSKRKGIVASILIPLALIMIAVSAVNFIVNDSCFFGHTPVETFCERPIICTKCETELEPAPGHQWITDSKTGQTVCVKCRANPINTE